MSDQAVATTKGGRSARYNTNPRKLKGHWERHLTIVLNEPVSKSKPDVKKIRKACETLVDIATDPEHPKCVEAIRLSMDLMGERASEKRSPVNVNVNMHLGELLARVEQRAQGPVIEAEVVEDD